MCATSGTGTVTLHENLSSPTFFCGVLVAQSFVFCVVFCRSLFVSLSFFLLYCPFLFDYQLLITP